VKPPNLASILKRFDCSGIDPLTYRVHLGYSTDLRTGLRVDLGHDAPLALPAPFAFVPVDGDQARELREIGDRFRDPRWLWCRTSLSPGRDGAQGVDGDLVIRSNGEIFRVLVRRDVDALTDFRGYLLARDAT
jgi:hypothetical protein